MDDVLVDFNAGFYNLFGVMPYDLPRDQMWSHVKTHNNFYYTLPPMQDYMSLWQHIVHLQPSILTAIPRKAVIPNAATDKSAWIAHYLGNGIEVCFGPYAHEKKNHCKPGDVLIDDRSDNINDWIAVGGIGILHTSAEQSIKQLRHYQII